ncbi:hypothetical protein SLS54_005297 [Diplodia seriata]
MPTDQRSQLRYIQWKEDFRREKPYQVLMDVPDGCPTSNFIVAQEPEQLIEDLRGQESNFNLDDHAFAIQNDHQRLTVWDKDTVETQYFPQIEEILKRAMGPSIKVYIFDWRTELEAGTVVDLNDPLRYLAPVQGVHVDQSGAAARKRVVHHMGENAAELLKGRFRIVKYAIPKIVNSYGLLNTSHSVWRPLRNPIEDWPLAVCDGSTVPEDKLLAADHVRKTYVGESLYPMFSENMRWYYLSRQTKDEVILLKTYDSSPNVRARCEWF